MYDSKYIELLLEQYKNRHSVITEMVNLQAIVNLPKGTEHFLSDIHGEYDAFFHILQNASGAIKMYIEDIFGLSLSQEDKDNLSLLIYYPDERLEIIEKRLIDNSYTEKQVEDFYKMTLFRLVKVLKRCTTKYTRSKVRKALPKEYAYVLEELIHEDINDYNKQMYYTRIISTIVEIGSEKEFIKAICSVIHRLVIDHLHIIGDIYDRGKYPDKVMDLLCNHHSVDIQWGNHDISWIGANCGNEALICTVVRLCAKHNNLSLLEDSYGINLVPLVRYALEMYGDDECESFLPTDILKEDNKKEIKLCAKIHKAITILELKFEAEIIKRRPEYEMEDRLLLNKIDYDKNVLIIDGKEYPLKDTLECVDKKNPYFITEDERDVVNKLKQSFCTSYKLNEHIEFIMKKGGMYKTWNYNLLFHGCVPMTKDKEFRKCYFLGTELYGKELIDEVEKRVRCGYNNKNDIEQKNIDLMWYLWCGKDSPLFGKDKMSTFERYFTDEKELKKETKDVYFTLRNIEEIAIKVLKEFGLNDEVSKIINGHVPVEVKKGESPVKANGRLIVIDGGLTKAYHKLTGIAGYTLISNSVGLYLAEHEPFTSLTEITQKGKEIISNNTLIERYQERMLVKDTDNGKEILKKIEELKHLLNAYENGQFAESHDLNY